MENIDLVGSDVFNMGDTEFFQCTTRNLIQLSWTVADTSVTFLAADKVGTSREAPFIEAYLVAVNVSQTTLVGNRTSLLVYAPPPDFSGTVSVRCEGGTLASQCVHFVDIQGEACIYTRNNWITFYGR